MSDDERTARCVAECEEEIEKVCPNRRPPRLELSSGSQPDTVSPKRRAAYEAQVRETPDASAHVQGLLDALDASLVEPSN